MTIFKSLYKKHRIIYTDPVQGFFSNIRFITMFIMTLFFFIIPWINYNKRQAIIFDITSFKLYFLNLIFWPQDFILLAILAIILIIFLFIITLHFGRVWCGFLCPQSIWIRMSNFLSRFIEGNRNKRKKADNSDKTFYFFYKKIIKHLLLIILAFLTSLNFIGYFIPIKNIFLNLYFLNVYNWNFFWILFFSIITYLNIFWFKEQFCFLVCPYARLQSLMFDENTLIVTYNIKRGEPRGHLDVKNNYKTGDCIDCQKCVTCCPTGIDIRNGLQIECISCGACIDACNNVMKKIGYKENLIAFSKENENKKIINIKSIAYFITILILLIVFIYNLINRDLFQINIIKSQTQLYNIKNNKIENYYTFKLINKTQKKNKYQIDISNNNFFYEGPKKIILTPEETLLIDIKIIVDKKYIKNEFTEINFIIKDIKNNKIIIRKIKFISPKND